MRDILEGFVIGLKHGLEWMYTVGFNKKVPKSICVLIALILLPLSLARLIAAILSGTVTEQGDEMIKEVEEYKKYEGEA